MQVADDVFLSTKPSSASVAAVSTAMDPTLPPSEVLNQAFLLPNQEAPTQEQQQSFAAQVAALARTYARGGRGGRGGRGNNSNRGGASNRGGGQGNKNQGASQKYSAQNPRHKTPRHPDLPPWGVCKRHWTYGKSSFCCLEPTTCEWKNFIQTPPQN